MEKERFLDLARNYTSLTEAETKDLDALQQQYPYSQVIHNLASRGAQDNNLESSKKLLNISAVYSTDRTVLKNIITAPRTARSNEHDAQVAVLNNEPIHVENAEAIIHVDNVLSGEALNAEIMSDLKRLQELKHNFEVTVEEFRHSNHTAPRLSKEPKPKAEKASPKEPLQKKKDETVAVTPEPLGEVLLQEIKTTKKRLSPETPRQKEQIEIIDQFIKKQPSMPKASGAPPVDASDLAEQSLSLTDNLVSETLVEILLRQGKKDKAIEVLKKLIWKFPQKKAIFAAQIDELKK